MNRAHLAAVASFVVAFNAHAGQRCEPHKPTPLEIVQALETAEHTRQALDASGAQVVLIARAGQDLSAYGLRYSHFGYAYRDDATHAWRIVHKLNHCGTDHAALYRQGLADFFMDQPWRYEAGVVVPAPEVQQALLPLRVRAQAWLRLHGYQPTTLHLSALHRLGAELSAANITFDDHPNARRFSGRIDTVTVDSVFAFVHDTGLGGDVRVVR